MTASKPNLAKATIIDVRTDYEYNLGHINNSICIPLDEIEERLEEIKKIKGDIVLCCQSGARSGNASEYLSNMGFDNVHNGGGWSILNLQVINAQ